MGRLDEAAEDYQIAIGESPPCPEPHYVLSDVVCDIRAELAQAEAERAVLSGCLEADLQRSLVGRDARH
jgi:hypothetical protein